MNNLTRALEEWRKVVGPEHVLTDPAALSAAETATFSTSNRIPAIVRPGSREEVRACVRVANEQRTPIYPVSTGKNWGYGSRVPAQDGCVLMELRRLDRITGYDEKLAYVTVEPGVTFRGLHEFLLARNSNLMLSVTGSTPDSSPVGNGLERGAGSGPYADRAAHVCGFEVVLPSGDVVHTGFGRFPGAETTKLHRWGVGPYLDGLFAQSNLGIVTEMTMWLAPRPDYFQSCFFGIDDDSRLEGLVDALQTLMLRGVFRAGLTVRNDFNVLCRMQQYPWEALGGATPMPPGLLERMRKGFWRDAWWSSLWVGWAELHHASREQGLAVRRIIEEALADKVDRLAFVDEAGVGFSRWDEGGDREVAAGYFGPDGREDGTGLGVPGDENLRSAYWRKKSPIPDDMDPDRDNCGVMFCVPTVPFEGRHVRAALDIVEETLSRHAFEPILIVGCIFERVVYLNVDITYDRDVAGEDERALGCHDEMLGRLIESGYLPYRLGIQSAGLLPDPDDDTGRLLGALKKTFDPHNILAPGRYGKGAEGRSREEIHARERG
jgi:4-cresol dehydrogenase (hydroxylating) flavoprotein subunit